MASRMPSPHGLTFKLRDALQSLECVAEPVARANYQSSFEFFLTAATCGYLSSRPRPQDLEVIGLYDAVKLCALTVSGARVHTLGVWDPTLGQCLGECSPYNVQHLCTFEVGVC